MIIKRISLNDFLSHKNTTVEFPLGVTVFVGPNGAGKTSIIDGIFVALFNHRPRGENWKDVIRRGSNRARIELEFEEGGVPYRIIWERRKSGTPVYKLYRADKEILIAEGVREVQAELEAITGLDRDSAINSILIRQGEITSLLDQSPADRKKIIGRLIGLDKLEAAWANTGELIRHFKDKLGDYKRLQGEYDYLIKQLKELESERQQLEVEIQELAQQIKAKEGELENTTRLLKTMEAKEEKHVAISNEIEKLSVQLAGVKENLERVMNELEQALDAKRKAEELLPQVQKLEFLENLQELLRDITRLKERKSALMDELAKIEELENTINKTAPFHEEYLKTEEEIKSLEKNIIELQPSREYLVRLEKEKERLLEELDKTDHKLQETLEQLKEYSTPLERIDESLLSKSPEELEKEITELKTKLEGNISRLNDLSAELEEVKNAKAKMEELEPLVSRLPLLKELKDLNFQISEKLREIERIQRILSSITNLRETLEKLQPAYEEYHQIETELRNLQEELDKIRGELDQLHRIEATLQEKEAHLRRLEKELKDLEEEILRFLPEPTPESREKMLAELATKIKEIKEKLRNHQDKIAALKGRINEINKYLTLLESSNICPVCHREMDESHKSRVRKEFMEEISQNQEEIRHLDDLSRALQTKLQELESLKGSIERLDVNKYQKMRRELEELMNEVSGLRKQVAELNELERRFSDINRTIKAKEERKKELEKEYHRYLMTKEQLENILKENSEQELQGRLAELETQVSQIKDKISHLASTLGGIPQDLDTEIGKLEEINAEYLHLKAKVERLESIEREINKIKDENERIGNIEIPSRLLAEKRILEQDIQELKKKLEDIETKIESAQKDVNRLKDLEAKREELRSKLEELKPEHEKYVGSVEALKRERPKGKVLEDIDKVSQQLSDLEEKKTELIKAVGEIPENIDEEISRLRKLKEEYIRASEKAKNVESLQKQLTDLKEKIKELESAIDSKKRELESLGFSEKELKKIQEKVRSIENDIQELNGKKSVKEGNLMQTLEKIENVKAQIETRERELKKVERIQKLVSDLERIRAAYHRDGVQRLLRQKIAPIISELATEYIENFNMDITDIYLSEDFDITVVKNSVEVPTSTLSGGEKVAVALALRLAIARALSRNLSVVIMDEPTTHLDEERRKDLVEILDRFFKSGEAIPQVVIVTHHPELETVADTLYLVRNVDGISQVKEVESLEEGF